MIVVHVGTNNVEHTADQVCEGILEIIRTIREKHPSAYIVLPVSIIFSLLIIIFGPCLIERTQPTELVSSN